MKLQHALLLTILIAIPSKIFAARSNRQTTTRCGNNVKVLISNTRATRLKTLAGTLKRINVPAYAALYKAKSISISPNPKKDKFGSTPTEGATLVASVDRTNIHEWYSKVGQYSIGFVSRSMPYLHKPTTLLRVGSQLYDYRAVRHDINAETNEVFGPIDIRAKASGYTEATFLVSKTEFEAFSAFVQSRHLLLIHDDKGTPIQPRWLHTGAKASLSIESCANACTSMLNPKWLEAFERSLPKIRQYGVEHNIPVLKNTSTRTVQVLKAFADRTGARVQTGFKEIIRANFQTADVITVFNGEGLGHNLLETLSWKKGKWYGHGLTAPKVFLDLNPSEGPIKWYDSERLSLAAFASTLR